MKINKINLNLVLVLAILAVISIPISYALVEPSIVLNMVSGQTTKPIQIKDNLGNEVFSVDTAGTIFPSVGGEVFTWTGNHSASGNSLTNIDILEFASVEQNIKDNGFGDLIFNVASTEAYLLKMGGITEYQFFGTGNGNQFALVEQNSITWNTDGHDITPSATDLTINVGTVNDRINLRTFDTDRFTINGQNAQISVPFDFNSNAITEAVINCSLNTCTNFPSGTSTTMIGGNHFGGLAGSSGDRFFFPSGQSDAVGNETEMIMVMTTSGTIDRLFVKYIEGGGNTLNVITTVTVRKNLADTSLTVNIPAGSTALVSNTSSSFTFVAGDEISVKFGIPSGTGAGSKPHWSFEITS